MMMMGAEGVFVGSGIFKSESPAKMALAVVQAVINWQDPGRLAAISEGLGAAMGGMEMATLETRLAARGI